MNMLRTGICFFSPNFPKVQYICPFIFSKQFTSYLGKWESPEGYDTGIMIYNSAVNQRVPLILRRKDLASWYMCGPTVYDESHIGHASCYVKFDIVRRILENAFSINVLLLLGITDIDDKIIKKANEAGVCPFQLAKKFELDFFQDMESMRVLPPTAISRVSENIPLIISFCEKLIEKEYAYVTSEGNVYFMVSKSATVNILNEISDDILSDMRRDPLKKDQRDFALWKAAKPNEPFWKSPWSNGRPGWHIECSAMASKIFGSKIDLHSGGSDLLFPHHANEKSQSEAFHGCSQWVNYWLHAGLLQVDDELKMSKSLGNTISIKDFLKEHCVNDFRILCLQSLYQKNFSYSCETLSGAKSLHKKIHNFINECESYISGEIKGHIVEENKLLAKLSITKEEVTCYLKNDFNTSKALLRLTDFIDEINKSLLSTNTSDCICPNSISSIANCYFYVNKTLEMFSIIILSKKKLPKELSFAVDAIVGFRNTIRSLASNSKNIRKDQTLLCYVNDAYKAMEMEVGLIYDTQVLPKFSKDLLEDCNTFYKRVYQFVEVLNSDKTLQLLDQIKSKEAKKKMAPLFVICDEFRSILNEKGIGIKDRGSSSSTWLPLIELQKMMSNFV